MIDEEGRIGIEIRLPVSVAAEVAALAHRRGDQVTAAELIEQLVVRAARSAGQPIMTRSRASLTGGKQLAPGAIRAPRTSASRSAGTRSRASLTGGDNCLMLAYRCSDFSIEQIARQLALTVADTEAHLAELDERHRAKSRPRPRKRVAA